MNEIKRNELSPFKNSVYSHVRDVLFSIGELKKAPLGSILTILAISIALALPFGLFTIVNNIRHIGGKPSPYISVYLKKNTEKQIAQIKNKLAKYSIVKRVHYVSPNDGLDLLNKENTTNLNFFNKKTNPLPGVFVLQIQDQTAISSIQMLANQLKAMPYFQLVQVNMTWVRRLHYIIDFSERLTAALTFVFSAAVLLIITNTIRLITQRNKENIQIMRLFGATKQFIRRPLLYRGMILGLLGGLSAWLLVYLVLNWMIIPLQFLAISYQSPLNQFGINAYSGIILTGISIVLSFIGAWVAVQPYLSSKED